MAHDRPFILQQLDQEKLIKENDLQVVTNPVMFNAGNGPTPDGLLSNEIFGITKEERSGIFAYIDLNEYFIQPYYYKVWLKIDKRLRGCIYETQNFKLDSDGYLVEDDNGETGIQFLRKNIDKLKFKTTKKDEFINVLQDGKKKGLLFTKKFVIIPPFFRDVNTTSSGSVGVGEINKLYINLMNNVKSLQGSNDYGLSMAGGTRGRIQDVMLEIYNWFTIGETVVGGEHTGSGIFKKMGLMRRSVMAKTSDYSARLVLSAPPINVNSQKDLMVDLDYSAVPLSAACVISYPYMIYYLRQIFNNEFGGKIYYNIDDNTRIELKDPLLEFSDERFDKEINEFVHGYSNRFKSIKIPNIENRNINMRFKGYSISEEEYINGKRESEVIIERNMTWVDLLYRAATDIFEDRMVMITRYPMDTYFNQLYTKANISSTVETEPMVINGKFYKWYPKIRQSDIGKNTSNKFIDTLCIANPYCGIMLADYDGDQVTIKMPYSTESNEELKKYTQSNAQFVTLAGKNCRLAGNEAIQAMYNLTLVLPETKLDEVEF